MLESFPTDLQENSDDSEPIRLASSLSKAWVFGVPVHQMELGINEIMDKLKKSKTKQKNSNNKILFL